MKMADEEKPKSITLRPKDVTVTRSKVGGWREEAAQPGHGVEGNRASREARVARKKIRTGSATEALDQSFKVLQVEDDGRHSFIEWAKRNNSTLTEFYKIWAKRVPSELSGAGGGPLLIKIKDV